MHVCSLSIFMIKSLLCKQMNVCQFKCSFLYNSIRSFILFCYIFRKFVFDMKCHIISCLRVRKHILRVNSKCQYFIYNSFIVMYYIKYVFLFSNKILYFSYMTIVKYFWISIWIISSCILLFTSRWNKYSLKCE